MVKSPGSESGGAGPIPVRAVIGLNKGGRKYAEQISSKKSLSGIAQIERRIPDEACAYRRKVDYACG